MGKIMLNGKQYGVGGIEKAKDISYDNTQSGMSATNVQGALDEVKAGLTKLPLPVYPYATTTSVLVNNSYKQGDRIHIEVVVTSSSTMPSGNIFSLGITLGTVKNLVMIGLNDSNDLIVANAEISQAGVVSQWQSNTVKTFAVIGDI